MLVSEGIYAHVPESRERTLINVPGVLCVSVLHAEKWQQEYFN